MKRLQWVLVLVCAGALAAGAQSVKITGGVVDYQVFQRGADNHADLKLAGTADQADGRAAETRVVLKSKAIKGFNWKAAGKVVGGQWTAEIKGVPTGGPYSIEVRVGHGVAAVKHVLVGDLWVLGGQSNMQGYGDLENTEPPNELVNSFDMADQWVLAKEPLHVMGSAADRVHWPLNADKQPERMSGEKLAGFLAKLKKGSGLGLPFAVEMVRQTGVPVGLVPCAHGGTSMNQWDPALKDKGGDSLYGGTIRRFGVVGGKVKGMLWYQGESDAGAKAAPLFREKFERMVAAFRQDFGQPDLPFYYVQIGRFIVKGGEAHWHLVQEMQRQAEQTIPHAGMASAIDFELDDLIHVGTPSLKRLGQRLAKLAIRDLFPDIKNGGPYKGGPRPVSATLQKGEIIRVAFSGVNGRLRHDGRLAGFTIHDANDEPLSLIYKAQVDPADASAVLLYFWSKLPEGATLHYGYGKDPYCNLRDDADMAAPVFGPLSIRRE